MLELHLKEEQYLLYIWILYCSSKYSQILITAANLDIPDLDTLDKCVSEVMTPIPVCLAVTQASRVSFIRFLIEFEEAPILFHKNV